MARLRSHFAAALLAALAGAWPTAGAAAETCAGRAIEADQTFSERWPELLDRLGTELASRRDEADCARVTLRMSPSTILLTVSLRDGRSATRELMRSEDVLPSLQALLLVPERPAPAASVTKPRSRPTRARGAIAPSSLPLRDESAGERLTEARRLGLELSLFTGSRVGDGQVSLGAGAQSFIELYGWLLGFQGRADAYRPLSGGDPETALELAVLGGKRWELAGAALDLVAGPGVATKGFALSRTESAHVDATGPSASPAPPAPEEPSSRPVPRLLLGARLGFSPRSVFRTFVAMDAELGPASQPGNDAEGSASLPRFAFGLSLGATVGTR
ncbi:MAG: hypothetical protein EOO73_03230 [Myxococcales bacterium]|nr:MAG: hypothetical protein EOO73_03230 [Myxococcales bacterium]